MTQSAQLFQFPSQDGQKEALDKAFEEVWKLWPNKAKKPLAKAKFLSIVNGCKTRTLERDSGMYIDIELQASSEEIVAGCKAYLSAQIDRKTFKMKDDGKFIPMLSTFLNGGRYLDNM